jgi:hypothetical protein
MPLNVRRLSGNFIQFLDADDLRSPSKIELQVLRLLENPMGVASSSGRGFIAPRRMRYLWLIIFRSS